MSEIPLVVIDQIVRQQEEITALYRLSSERLDLLADCLEQIGLRDERGLWGGALSTAEELIEHMVAAGRLVRVAGEGPARWEWVEATGG